MSTTDENSSPRSFFRPRFSLLALLVFVTLACLILPWVARPPQSVATALFRVASKPPGFIDAPDAQRPEANEFETYVQTQITLLKSDAVLTAAVRKPGIAALPFLKANDPVELLRRHLVVGNPLQSEILSVSLRGPEKYSADLVQIVDAVAAAYEDEVISAERQRVLAERDRVAGTLEELTAKIASKAELRHALEAESADETDALKALESDLVALQQVSHELVKQLQRSEINAQAPARVMLIQQAVASRAE
jgi:hypothetical protein